MQNQDTQVQFTFDYHKNLNFLNKQGNVVSNGTAEKFNFQDRKTFELKVRLQLQFNQCTIQLTLGKGLQTLL